MASMFWQRKSHPIALWGALIRASARTGRLPPREELEAFVNDRREHVRDVIEPGLNAGHVVIVDRYFLSTVAYQGARGLDTDEVFRLNDFAPLPQLLFILDVPPRVGLERVAKRGDVADLFEKEDELSKAREIFTNRELLQRHVPHAHILDAMRTKQDLSKDIWKIVSEARLELAASQDDAELSVA
jgi:dTMP kinase